MAINLFQSAPNNIFQQQNPIFSNNTQSQQVIGSYRGQFKQIKLIDNSERDELQSTNCYVQTEYKGISPMQVRLEDYYLIRSQQLQQFHKTQIERAYRNGNFNGKLLNSNNTQNLKPPTFPKSNELYNSTNTIFNSNNNNNNRQNNNLFQQTNTNIFANNQNNNNIFNQSNTTMPSSNIFNQTTQSNNNIFSQSNNTNNNMFSQNIFSNNQNSNIFNQQQPNNNLFQSQNIFQNPNIFQNAQSQINSYPMYNQPYLKYDYAAFQGVEKLQESINFAQSIYLEIASFEQNQQQSQDQFDQMMRENTNKYQLYMPPTNKKSIKQGGILSKPTSITSQSTIMHSKSQVNKTTNQVKKKISQFNDRECSYYNIQIEIEILESEKTLSLMSEFQCRSKVHQVKQFVENHLLNIEVFGKQSQLYFDNCLIQNEKGDEIDQTQPIAENKKIYFKYFIQKQPKLIRNEYSSNLSQYSDYSCVYDFTVWTQYGSVRWPSETNLLYIDLDKIIDINYEQIEIYDTKKIHPLLKPEIGNKLNKECFITFKFNFNKNNNKQKIEFNIQKQAQKQGLEYVSIDFDQEVFTVKAKHFSGYRFNSDYSSTDESCYRIPQHQVEVQTQEVEQCYEESENESESLSIQIKDESNLQKRKQFDQCFADAKNKNRQLNEQQINQHINYINNKFNKQIPLLSQKQKDQSILNIDVLEQYFHSNLLFDFKVNSQQTTAVLLNTLYQNKNPTDEIIRTFKLLNILFGSPSIDLVQFLELLYQEKIAFEDILTTSKQQKLRGLALSLFLEQFKMKHEQIEFREDCISQQKKFENLQNVLVTLNYRQNNTFITQIQKIDWIDCFTYWRLNKQQPLPLYQKDWWNALYNEIKTQNCSTPQFAALLYFLLKKTKQPQSEWKKLYDFFTKSSDSFSIILFHIISQRCKQQNQSLKIIGKSFIEKFIQKQVSQELMNNLLISFENKIFEKKEIDVIKNHISKHVFYYSQTIITGQKIHYYLNTQNFLKALETILIENKQNEYEQIMKNILIPYLILYSDRQKEDQYLIDLIKKVIQQMKNDDMSKICMMYLDKQYFDQQIIRNWIVCNDYQYHMKQLIVRMFNDEF